MKIKFGKICKGPDECVSKQTELVADDLVEKLIKGFEHLPFAYSLNYGFCENGSISLDWNYKRKNLQVNVSKNGDYLSYWGKSAKTKIETEKAVEFVNFYKNNFKELKSFFRNSA